MLRQAVGLAGNLRQLLLAGLAAQRVGQARQHIAALRRRQQRAGIQGARLVTLTRRHDNGQHRLRQINRVHRQHIEPRRLQRIMAGLETRPADELVLRELHQPRPRLGIQHKDRPARGQGHSPVLKGQHKGIENNSIHHPRCDSATGRLCHAAPAEMRIQAPHPGCLDSPMFIKILYTFANEAF